MSELWTYILVYIVLSLQKTSCNPVNKFRLPRNEVQYSNGTVMGSYSYKDGAGNPIEVKYYADKTGYGVELNNFKTMKIIDTTTNKEELHKLNPVKDYNINMEPMKPLLDLAAQILNFDNKLYKATNADTTTKHPDTLNHLEHLSKVTKLNTPDYEKYYQNEVKAPKQCEKDKVRVYLAKDKRKKKNAIEDANTKVI